MHQKGLHINKLASFDELHVDQSGHQHLGSNRTDAADAHDNHGLVTYVLIILDDAHFLERPVRLGECPVLCGKEKMDAGLGGRFV